MYASRTGTKRNLAIMRECGWRLLVVATGVWRNEGFPYAIDNGAWTYHRQGLPFDGARFRGLVSAMGRGADWIVLPDVVGDAKATAATTEDWLDALDGYPTLAVIQDNAEDRVLDRLVGRVRGYFLGGSTEYKLATVERWGAYCRERSAYYHVGRVNTARRIHRCEAAGADSIDGTSGTQFAVNIRRLDRASRQMSLHNMLHAPAETAHLRPENACEEQDLNPPTTPEIPGKPR